MKNDYRTIFWFFESEGCLNIELESIVSWKENLEQEVANWSKSCLSELTHFSHFLLQFSDFMRRLFRMRFFDLVLCAVYRPWTVSHVSDVLILRLYIDLFD